MFQRNWQERKRNRKKKKNRKKLQNSLKCLTYKTQITNVLETNNWDEQKCRILLLNSEETMKAFVTKKDEIEKQTKQIEEKRKDDKRKKVSLKNKHKG